MTIEPISAPTPAIDTTPAPKTVEQAAQQFESLLIAQMLRSARESSSDQGEDDEDGASEKSTMLDLSEQQFAQMLSQKGGLNLSGLIVDGLKAGESQNKFGAGLADNNDASGGNGKKP